MREARIVIIGAGSTIYALEVIKDLCGNSRLAQSHVWFVDVNPERLRISLTLCRRYAQEVGSAIEITGTTERAEALRSADFVISTALTLGYDKMLQGWDLAEKYGFRQDGSLHLIYDEAFWVNFYQLQLFEGIVEDMLALCPEAWFFMVSNPVMAGVTYLGRKYPQAKVAGVCHGYREIFSILQELGLDPDKATWDIPGSNHFVWLNAFTYDGRNAFPLLDQWIAEKGEAYWASGSDKVRWGTLGRKLIDLYRIHGVLPIGDTAHWIANNWPWWYSGTDTERAAWDQPPLREKWMGFFDILAREQQARLELADDPTRKVSEAYPGKSDEHIIDMVDAIANDQPGDFVVNILNTDNLVPGVPLDFEVEVKARLSAGGLQTRPSKPLPRSVLAHLLRDRIAPVETELAAFERGSYDLLVELILMDRWAPSKQAAEAFLDDLLALPWNTRMKTHYARTGR
ncbi:MAG TPA: hypothetical protein VGB55_13605 [Tepidisphaeraceae bacterium]